MYVVINTDPGSTLNELMAFMTQKTITFSVTDNLSKLYERPAPFPRPTVIMCHNCVWAKNSSCKKDNYKQGKGGEGRQENKWRETGTQTEEDSCYTPPAKRVKLSNGDTDCVSPCSSATPSESVDLGVSTNEKPKTIGNGNNNWVVEDGPVLRGLIKSENDSSRDSIRDEEPEEDASVEDVMNSELQSQLMQALFPKGQNGTINGFSALDDNESLDGRSGVLSEFQDAFRIDGSPASAIRYKPAYASTKRGVCHVCNREVSLITTHRRRHAITHLGFKTLRCALCHKFFSRQDLATGHFKKDHPTAEFTPFIDTMSPEDEKQLVLMMGLCFPDETQPRKKGDKPRTEEQQDSSLQS